MNYLGKISSQVQEDIVIFLSPLVYSKHELKLQQAEHRQICSEITLNFRWDHELLPFQQ
jgi:hypothetical protein